MLGVGDDAASDDPLGQGEEPSDGEGEQQGGGDDIGDEQDGEEKPPPSPVSSKQWVWPNFCSLVGVEGKFLRKWNWTKLPNRLPPPMDTMLRLNPVICIAGRSLFLYW